MRNTIIKFVTRPIILVLMLSISGCNSVAFAESDVVPIQTVLLEAHCDGLLGMICVGEVIRNRAKRSGETPSYECMKKWQFSCWNNRGTTTTRLLKHGLNDYKLAKRAWELSKTSDYTKGATHYFNPKLCLPSWAKNMVFKGNILNHSFYSEK